MKILRQGRCIFRIGYRYTISLQSVEWLLVSVLFSVNPRRGLHQPSCQRGFIFMI